MAFNYEYGENPFNDILTNALIVGMDISTKKSKKNMHAIFEHILENVLVNPKNIIYLDFDILKTKNGFKVVGKNILCAFWLSGLLIEDINMMREDNGVFIIGDRKYKYNKENYKLTYKKINE